MYDGGGQYVTCAGTPHARAHRETLPQAMVQAGFRANRLEWRHYDAPEARGAPMLDEPEDGERGRGEEDAERLCSLGTALIEKGMRERCG